jgi:glucose-6-phosphate-specific signal transduction histidine kinase
MVAAALLDNYNNIVKSVRTSTTLIQRTSSSSSEQNAANSVTANAYKKGDILKPKIGGVEVLVKPEDSSEVVAKLSKEDEVLYLGIEKDGFYKIKSIKGDGWVESMMLKK